MLELYHHGTSVCAAKVRLVLEEKGLEWTGHYLDILKGDQFDPAYLELNPKAVVPTLVHDGEVLTESTVICAYLDDALPEPPLTPREPLARARMRLWMKAVDDEVHPACAVVTFVASHRHRILKRTPEEVRAFLDSTPKPADRERKRRWVEEGFEAPGVQDAIGVYDKMLGRMEAALNPGPWLLGARFTLADIALIPYVNRLDMLGMSEMWTKARPRLAGWFERVKARPSFQPALFAYIPQEMVEELRTNGAASWPRFREVLAAA